MDEEFANALLSETKAVKMLLVLQLLSSGTSQKQIALMLGVNKATMSRMIPKGLGFGKEKPQQRSRRATSAEA